MRTTGVKEKAERAAIDLFAARGVNGVSIADIADAAGISQGALYRHYRSKGELAGHLFLEAYRLTGAELQAIVAREQGFSRRIEGMVGHFCDLYDRDAALFRFMLLAQHELLPAMSNNAVAPAAAVEQAVAAAIEAGELGAVDIPIAAATIMGIVLQTALFHVYGRVAGSLAARAPALARAAIAAARALGRAG
ncbi:MAG TPA: helix-turn-helix domain-containing protein [Stellaceae bacterium]|nr:helix-turn-helix domain-containing protein [Stellaceae bacterium]